MAILDPNCYRFRTESLGGAIKPQTKEVIVFHRDELGSAPYNLSNQGCHLWRARGTVPHPHPEGIWYLGVYNSRHRSEKKNQKTHKR